MKSTTTTTKRIPGSTMVRLSFQQSDGGDLGVTDTMRRRSGLLGKLQQRMQPSPQDPHGWSARCYRSCR